MVTDENFESARMSTNPSGTSSSQMEQPQIDELSVDELSVDEFLIDDLSNDESIDGESTADLEPNKKLHPKTSGQQKRRTNR